MSSERLGGMRARSVFAYGNAQGALKSPKTCCPGGWACLRALGGVRCARALGVLWVCTYLAQRPFS
eukprot:6213513-Prymnesium_polylepis.1